MRVAYYGERFPCCDQLMKWNMKVLVTAYNRDYFCELRPCGKICDFVARPMDSSWVVGVIFLVRADVNGKDGVRGY